jgi:uncharacterized protein GlcG (DUF336 family)
MPNLVKKHSISFELAQKMVDAAVAKAREIGVSENVVILDDGGNLKAFGRMDGAPIPTIEMAQNKAYTALLGVSTALAAFQQVEDNLAALRILEAEAGQQHHAVVSAQESLQLFTNRYKGGVDTYLQVVTSQTSALANERNETDIHRRRMDATVLLIKALGGDWNVSNLPKL